MTLTSGKQLSVFSPVGSKNNEILQLKVVGVLNAESVGLGDRRFVF